MILRLRERMKYVLPLLARLFAVSCQVMAPNQGTVCENNISGVDYVSGGSDDQDQEQFTEEVATGSCSRCVCRVSAA